MPEEEIVDEMVQQGEGAEAEREVVARADGEWGGGHAFDPGVKRAQKGTRREEVEPQGSYAERVRGFRMLTSGGSKTGTLYYMDHRRLRSRPTE